MDYPTDMCIWAIFIGLGVIFWKWLEEGPGEYEEWSGYGYDYDALHTCMKFSKNKLKIVYIGVCTPCGDIGKW